LLRGLEQARRSALAHHVHRIAPMGARSIEEALYLADRIVVITPRPARIDKIMDVPFARPRDEDVKATSEFVAKQPPA
jgi:ABC-type nitrate/sulfonate/bicarbonate transport system ATPase subunit